MKLEEKYGLAIANNLLPKHKGGKFICDTLVPKSVQIRPCGDKLSQSAAVGTMPEYWITSKIQEDRKHTRTLYAYTQRWAKAAKNRTTKMLCSYACSTICSTVVLPMPLISLGEIVLPWFNASGLGTQPLVASLLGWRVAQTFSHFGR